MTQKAWGRRRKKHVKYTPEKPNTVLMTALEELKQDPQTSLSLRETRSIASQPRGPPPSAQVLVANLPKRAIFVPVCGQ